ncbi:MULTISPECIES: type II toxin-antitoxin system RelE/ParE family toxin [unclassified Sphingomonas]|jgi:toxin ParE1/3/4|nr:type II toxin-antitoxin system RelE/ParE family toxin [Sphingomonas sp.]AXJ97016.1 type II toxin-antitoxin system RelE/ParE family toxin [Sphingomonas sp. FARSPH]
MSFRVTPRADEDYYAIYAHGVERFGRAQAEAYADRLDESFAFLADHPRAARMRYEFDPPVRALPVGAHMIVYDVEPDDTVVILRIPHGRADWAND